MPYKVIKVMYMFNKTNKLKIIVLLIIIFISRVGYGKDNICNLSEVSSQLQFGSVVIELNTINNIKKIISGVLLDENGMMLTSGKSKTDEIIKITAVDGLGNTNKIYPKTGDVEQEKFLGLKKLGGSDLQLFNLPSNITEGITSFINPVDEISINYSSESVLCIIHNQIDLSKTMKPFFLKKSEKHWDLSELKTRTDRDPSDVQKNEISQQLRIGTPVYNKQKQLVGLVTSKVSGKLVLSPILSDPNIYGHLSSKYILRRAKDIEKNISMINKCDIKFSHNFDLENDKGDLALYNYFKDLENKSMELTFIHVVPALESISDGKTLNPPVSRTEGASITDPSPLFFYDKSKIIYCLQWSFIRDIPNSIIKKMYELDSCDKKPEKKLKYFFREPEGIEIKLIIYGKLKVGGEYKEGHEIFISDTPINGRYINNEKTEIYDLDKMLNQITQDECYA